MDIFDTGQKRGMFFDEAILFMCKENPKGLLKCIKVLQKEIEETMDWILVKDKLPDMNQTFIVSDGKDVWMAHRGVSDEGWGWYDGFEYYSADSVTHWMIPKPPK